MEKQIGQIGNYYGNLCVKVEDGYYYWAIENWTGWYWEEIPKYLYDALNRFEEEVCDDDL